MKFMAILAITALILSGCAEQEQVQAPIPGMSSDDFYAQELTWKDCSDGYECATIRAPLDWSNPAFGTVELALQRDPAAIDSRSLVINPGGPGVSANQWLRAQGTTAVTAAVADEFHLVSFDPRGVGQSSAIACEDDQLKDQLLYQETSNLDAEETQTLIGNYINICKQGSGALIEFVDTVSTARDLELIRVLIDDGPLNYLGYSYGSELGAVYLALFPESVGRFVFDGAIDPTLSKREEVVNQLMGFDGAFASFLEYCERVSCALSAKTGSSAERTKSVIDDLALNPVRVGSRLLTSSGLLTGIIAALYSQDSWPVLAQAFNELDSGDGELILRLADLYNQRNPDGSYQSNLIDANIAIGCADSRLSSDPIEVASLNRELSSKSLVFGTSWSDGHLICENWPGDVRERNLDYGVETAGDVIVVGTTNDPATPYQQAVSLSEILENATLISFEGEGHTIYAKGIECVDKRVDGFLISGAVPQMAIC